jgi:Flp pilus assembly protein TadG
VRQASVNRDESGTALVEFALVLPLFLVLVTGMLHFGKAINYWLDQSHLASEAARFASVNKNPGADDTPAVSLQEWIRQQADTAELRGAAIVCVEFPDDDSPDVGESVRITVRSTYNWIPILEDVVETATTPIRGSATMRIEQAPTNYSTSNNPTGCSA